MAVVFISPKQRQRTFLLGITVAVLLFLAAVFSGVFFSKPKQVLPSLVFNKPKVSVDMSIFDSSQFKGLQPFTQMETQFSYKATTKKNEQKTGTISAVSKEQARIILENMELAVSELKESEAGRDNPFAPYYESVAEPETE